MEILLSGGVNITITDHVSDKYNILLVVIKILLQPVYAVTRIQFIMDIRLCMPQLITYNSKECADTLLSLADVHVMSAVSQSNTNMLYLFMMFL